MFLVLIVVAAPGSVSADQPGYTDCMNRAINHKYAMIADGTSYAEAHEHYIWHTQVCYSRYWGDGSGVVPESGPEN